MTSSNSHPSYFEAAFGKPVNLVWLIRGFAAAALVAITLAMFVFKTGGRHDFCLGLAAGTLIGLLVQSSIIRNVDLKENQQRSDVNHYPLT
jgi:hypothetical protein